MFPCSNGNVTSISTKFNSEWYFRAKLNPKISFVEKTRYFELFNFPDEKCLSFQNDVDSFQETSETLMKGKSLRNKIVLIFCYLLSRELIVLNTLFLYTYISYINGFPLTFVQVSVKL